MQDLAALKDKTRTVETRLTALYGERQWQPGRYSNDLVGALIATVLSQNTSDTNSGRAFQSLKSRFPGGWDTVRTASVTDVADAIKRGGMANQKAPRIQAILEDIYAAEGAVNLDCLRSMCDDDVRTHLTAFHGVGQKTAACVLMFNLGRNSLPVDTHVHRVSQRLGLLDERASADAAHVLLPPLLGPDGAYSFHVHLIEHGRTLCHARGPECPECPLTDVCDYFNGSAAVRETATSSPAAVLEKGKTA